MKIRITFKSDIKKVWKILKYNKQLDLMNNLNYAITDGKI